MSKTSIPRGTCDIFPQETPLWQDVEKKARKLLSVYGYKEIRTPAFEETSLFARSLGSATDIVQKQMLNLEKDGLSLRPEGTASVVRAYIENSFDKKESLTKLYYIGPMFRGERPQKGRLRQFHQIGVEVLGRDADSPYLDAEVVALSVRLLESFCVTDFTLKINSLGTLKDKENFSKILRGALKTKKSLLCADCTKRFERNVFRILDCKNKKCKEIVAKMGIGNRYLSPESEAYFDRVLKSLDALNVKYKVCPELVRGLDYYTHTVFELSSAALGSQDAIGAGGRYGNLVKQLGGADVGAIGFALGLERIMLALPERHRLDQRLTAYVIALDEACAHQAFRVLNDLRSFGFSSDMSYRIASIKSQMRSANKSGAKFVLIIGSDELKNKTVTLKDMDTGSQEPVSIEHIGEVIKNKL